MEDNEINTEFEAAFKRASSTTKKLPPDVMLQLYAYYKKATEKKDSAYNPELNDNDLKSAFKYNAIVQAGNLKPKDAKRRYIQLVRKYID